MFVESEAEHHNRTSCELIKNQSRQISVEAAQLSVTVLS